MYDTCKKMKKTKIKLYTDHGGANKKQTRKNLPDSGNEETPA